MFDFISSLEYANSCQNRHWTIAKKSGHATKPRAMTFEHVPRQRSSRSVKQQVFAWSALAVRCPVQLGRELCASVTLGSVRGLKYGDWRLYHCKFTWKYEEYFFNNQRHQTKKNQLLGPALTNRFLCFNHLYVQQFPYNRALPAGRLYCYKL